MSMLILADRPRCYYAARLLQRELCAIAACWREPASRLDARLRSVAPWARFNDSRCRFARRHDEIYFVSEKLDLSISAYRDGPPLSRLPGRSIYLASPRLAIRFNYCKIPATGRAADLLPFQVYTLRRRLIDANGRFISICFAGARR